MAVRRVILATAEYDPLKSKAVRLCREICDAYNLELQVLDEDWDFLIKYGERDEIGGIDLPQIFIEYEDGKIEHVMTRFPLNKKGKIDYIKAKDILEEKIREEKT